MVQETGKDVINIEIPKGSDQYHFLAKMLQNVANEYTNRKSNGSDILNLQISSYKNDDGEIYVQIHEGFCTAFIPAVSTCLVASATMDEAMFILKELILTGETPDFEPKAELEHEIKAYQKFLEEDPSQKERFESHIQFLKSELIRHHGLS